MADYRWIELLFIKQLKMLGNYLINEFWISSSDLCLVA
jgi:hypothetical protein